MFFSDKSIRKKKMMGGLKGEWRWNIQVKDQDCEKKKGKVNQSRLARALTDYNPF
jgi:hypothetical protein